MAIRSEIMSHLISSMLQRENELTEKYGAAEESMDAMVSVDRYLRLDGLACPMPLLKAKLQLKQMSSGEVLFVRSTDSGSWRDIPAYINKSSHELLASREFEGGFEFWVRHGGE